MEFKLKKSNIHFITFGDGGTNYKNSAQRLINQVNDTGWFDTATNFNLSLIDSMWIRPRITDPSV